MVRIQHHRQTAVRLENKVKERVQDGVMKAATVAWLWAPDSWKESPDLLIGKTTWWWGMHSASFKILIHWNSAKESHLLKKLLQNRPPDSKSHPLCPAPGWVISPPMNGKKRVHRFSEVDGQWQASAVHCLWEGSGGLQVFRDSHLWVNRSRDGLIYQRYEKCN